MTSSKADNSVYYISLALILGIVIWGLISPASFGSTANSIFAFLTTYMGWWYMLSMNIFVIFPICLACSRFGDMKLGDPDSKPEFTNLSWFAMLFSAGMGIGLVFYGVGEPLYHFSSPPFGAQPGSPEAAQDALRISFFHWGLHPWANYAVIALSLAYFQFRKGAPGLMSSMFLPLLGEKAARTMVGKAIDILAIFATIAGIGTSLGLGVLQINSGLNYVFNLPKSVGLQLAIIIVLGLLYTLSAVSGIEKGIKFISNLNLTLACGLALALLAIGPTIAILEALMSGIGGYFSNLVSESFTMAPYGGTYKDWLGSWTLYYWAWWIAWAPFVGSFIARISRGRTIRQFVTGVLLVPAFGSFCWFAIFGASGLHLELNKIAELGKVINADISVGVFEMYKYYALGGLMTLLMLVLICTFFITSANSATYVLAMYSSGGSMNPPKIRMGIWGVLQAALAFVLLLGGGLKALQIASITAAGPFSIIMVVACWCLWRTLCKDNPS